MRFQHSFQFTEAFLVETMTRYRRQSRARWPRVIVRFAVILFLLALAVTVYIHGDRALPICLVAVCGAFLFSQRIDDWFMRRRFRKSPFYNEQIVTEVADDGVHTTSAKFQTKLAWTAFTKAVRFPDGLLLFQGPRVVNWLPFSALADSNTVESLTQLVASKTADFRTCGVKP